VSGAPQREQVVQVYASQPRVGHDEPEIRVVLADDVPVPAYAHPGDAGADLVTRVDVTLGPGERVTVPTGVRLALPDGYAAFVHPRSGLARRHGLTVVNAPGTVDAGYRGEIEVTLLNTDLSESIHLVCGDRIAQLVVQQVSRADFVVVDELPDSDRGQQGFGSTGGWAHGGAGPSRGSDSAE
jgi:dUTP pyrophosphatase